MRLLLVDNFDSFTFNLVAYFKELGAEVIVVRNDEELPLSQLKKVSGIVLAPGPGRPENSGNLMKYLSCHLPTLGICLGHQAIGIYSGAQLLKGRPMHGKITEIEHLEDPIFKDIPARFKVVRYHSLLLENLSDQLTKLAWSSTGECMAVKHNNWPFYGLQYHPEAVLTAYGHKVLSNWMNLL